MSSTRTLVTLLRPWIRRFTIIISAWWLRTSSKFTWEEVKTSTGKLGKWSTPKRVRIRPKYSAPSLSRDRRIKMHQSINQSISIENKTCYDFTLVCQALILPERFPQKIRVIFNCSLNCDATGMTPLICGISSRLQKSVGLETEQKSHFVAQKSINDQASTLQAQKRTIAMLDDNPTSF